MYYWENGHHISNNPSKGKKNKQGQLIRGLIWSVIGFLLCWSIMIMVILRERGSFHGWSYLPWFLLFILRETHLKLLQKMTILEICGHHLVRTHFNKYIFLYYGLIFLSVNNLETKIVSFFSSYYCNKWKTRLGWAPFITDPPRISCTTLSRHLTCHMWHVTCDMWHVKCDMWQVTCDRWHVTGYRW